MTVDDLKLSIITANEKYRAGESTLSDGGYDALLEDLKSRLPQDEFIDFQNSLNEGRLNVYGSKVKHPFIMGSLDKVKAENPQDLLKFIKSNVATKLSVSAKIDGISCRLHYENGKLVSGSTRGDGTIGTDISDKIFFIKGIPHSISYLTSIDIRGELVILKSDFENLEGFANGRNACAGLINRKECPKEMLASISFIGYTILGQEFTKNDQFIKLAEFGFSTAWNIIIDVSKASYLVGLSESLTSYAMQAFEYETDGLVISDVGYINADKYRPDKQIAFKINHLEAITTIIDVEFEGPSKDGFLIPVGILDPVTLGGSVISRVSLHNLDFISKLNLMFGSKIKLRKSGDVIPAVVALLDNPKGCLPIEYPEVCQCCGTPLLRDGVNLKCTNKECKDQIIYQLMYFIKKLGIKNVSNLSLKNFGIYSFSDLIKFRPAQKYKSEVKLYDELISKVFSRSKQDLLAAMNFRGVSELLINKIVDFYGLEALEEQVATSDTTLSTYPSGVGQLTIRKFLDGLKGAVAVVNMFINDSRWKGQSGTQNESRRSSKWVGSVCFTGSLSSLSRNEAGKLAEKAGYEVKPAVSKGLTFLVTNTPLGETSKNKKARELGVKILSEVEFLTMVRTADIEHDVETL